MIVLQEGHFFNMCNGWRPKPTNTPKQTNLSGLNIFETNLSRPLRRVNKIVPKQTF